MDDDDLTQDILDQFDLICTQHQAEFGVHPVAKPPVVCDLRSSNVSHTEAKLVRTKSLDARASSGLSDVPAQEPHANTLQEPSKHNEECDRLKKEVATLREELYMKLGELATIKESANRTNAAKSDAIIRLESSLNTEREEFQRRLSELTTQLAFREADYRLVTSELARVKEQVAVVKAATPQESNGLHHAPEFSPASQIIAAMTVSPYTTREQPSLQSPPQNHLPAPVTPIPSRRRPRHVDGTWRVPTITKDTPLSPPPKLENGFHPSLDTVPPATETVEHTDYGPMETPRKRPRHSGLAPLILDRSPHRVLSLVDVAVGTDVISPPEHFAGKLRYRISRNFSKPDFSPSRSPSYISAVNPTPKRLASDLLRLVVLDETDCRTQRLDEESGVDCALPNLPGSSLIWTDHYLKGIGELTSCGVLSSSSAAAAKANLRSRALLSASFIASLADALPHLLVRIEHLLRLIPTFLHRKQSTSYIGSVAPSSANERDVHELEVRTSEQEDETEGISYLGEDPFAGAPASQIVAPLRHLPFRRTCSVDLQRVPKVQNNIASSAPATVISNHLSTAHSTLKSDARVHERMSTSDQTIFQHGLSALKQLQCILTCLQQWQVTVHNYPSGAHVGDDTLLSGIKCQIGRLISAFVNQLVDIYVSRLEVTTTQEFCLISSTQNIRPSTVLPPTTTHTQLSGESTRLCFAPQSESSDPHCSFSVFSTSFSHLVLNITDLLACLMTNRSQDKENTQIVSKNLSSLEWSLSFVDSILLTAGTQTESTRVPEIREDPASVSSSTAFTSFLLFIRLARNMVTAGLWNLGHQTGAWWQNVGRQKLEVTGGRYEAICQLFGVNISCCLRAIVTWVRKTADQFESSVTNPDELLSSGSAPDATNRCSPFDRELKLVQLLNEFSKLVVALLERSDIEWPENCPCKSEVYSTLIHLAKLPVQQLLTLPAMTSTVDSTHLNTRDETLVSYKYQCVLSAFGQLTRALTALLWRHGDSCFQAYTDTLPSYFFVISSLSRWIQKAKSTDRCSSTLALPLVLPNNACEFVIRPELVEELHDFESMTDNSNPKS